MKKNHGSKIARILLGVAAVSVLIFLILPKGEKIQFQEKTVSVTPTVPQFDIHFIELRIDGFIPRSIIIKKGDVVNWINKSGKQASINSAEFPTHKLFPELNLGTFNNGSRLQVKLETLGELRYVNFFNSQQKGTILVED